MSIACKKLNFGDCISIISPSSPTPRETINESLKKISDLNFNYKIYNHLFDEKNYLAGEDSNRARDFNDALVDKTSKAIWCLRGGYGSLRILDLINFNLMKKNPKIFMGFSDLTPVLNYIFKKYKIITFHSPMLTSDLNNTYSKNSLINSITIPKNNYYIENPKDTLLKSFSSHKKKASGHIVGGNLSLICSTISTKYEIEFKNNILFIEEINESPYKIDRMLTHLFLSGKIQKCNGIILGQFTNCFEKDSYEIENLLIEKLYQFKKPCIYNLCSGHGEPKLTIPIGAKAQIDCTDNSIKILENVVI